MFSPIVLIGQLVLLATVIGGWFLGKYLHRWILRRTQRSESTGGDLSRLSDTVGFVGGAAGILLGLLLVFAVQHYSDAQAASRDEAVTSARLFYALGPFDASERTDARQALLCYMESVAKDDWKVTAAGDVTGSENTTAWSKVVRTKLGELTIDSDQSSTGLFMVDEQSLGIAEHRQFRLLIAQPQIPFVVWIVILLSSLVLSVLMALHLGDRKYLGRVSIAATYVVLAVSVGSLGVLDEPFNPTTGGIKPTAMQGTISTLEDSYPEAVPQSCQVLKLTSIDPQ